MIGHAIGDHTHTRACSEHAHVRFERPSRAAFGGSFASCEVYLRAQPARHGAAHLSCDRWFAKPLANGYRAAAVLRDAFRLATVERRELVALLQYAGDQLATVGDCDRSKF